MTAFLTASAACEAFATALNEISGRVTQPIEGLEGVANDAYDDAVARMSAALNISADDLMTASEAAATQDTYDAALMKAPSPDDVEAAQSAMEKVKVAAVSGAASPDALLTAVNECARIKGERDAALEQHTTDTTSTVFPKSMTDELGGPGSTPGTTPGSGEPEIKSIESGDDQFEDGAYGNGEPEVGGGSRGDNTDNPGTVAGDDGNAAPPTSTSPVSSGDTTPNRMGSNLSDNTAPANTMLSTDGGATLSPQAGSLSTPQSAQPAVTSPAAQPAPVTGAGNMLSNNPQPRGGSNQQPRSSNNDRRDDGKMSAGEMNALLAPVAAPAGGVPTAGSPAMSSPGTAPSGAPASAPAGAPAPAASGATPPASGANPNASPTAGPGGAMMGSGAAAQAKNQAMAPKPEVKPVISQELLDRAAELSKDGKPTDDTKGTK